MKSHLKVMSVVGTRPEIIRLSCVLALLDEYFEHVFVYTNQSFDYEMSQIFFEELKLRKPDHILNVRADTIGQQIGNILSQTEKIMMEESPDAILILGDTNSSLSAIIAKRLKIPIFHMEAGNRSFDWNVPEEINRRIVDHISDYNLAYTEHSRRYLIAEGIPPQNVFVTGSPLREVLSHFSSEIERSNVLEELKLSKHKYFLVSAHREENVESDQILKAFVDSLNYLCETYMLPAVVSVHPRTRKRIETLKLSFHKNVLLHKPFGFFAYNKLQKNAYCVLSDSGSIQEESAISGFCAVQIRVSTERPEAFDSGSIILCGVKKDSVALAVRIATSALPFEKPVDYTSVHVADKVVRLITGLASLRKK